MTRSLRICLVASSRYPIREPFAGGLEAHTLMLARGLRERGHRVALFAAPGSHHGLDVEDLPAARFEPSPAARSDVGAAPVTWMREHHAYLELMLSIAQTGRDRFDVVHNNSLHHLPLAMAQLTDVPVVTTLHTPPLAWLESAMEFVPPSSRFVAVSEATSATWAHAVRSRVVRNGVDTSRWTAGKGGGPAVWTGRLVPEKGPHLAAQACRSSGRDLVIAGPILAPEYFRVEVEPLLGDRVRYAGHLTQPELNRLVGNASVALVTPCWEEPYGLVAAEAMACGTPVAAFARGALPEILDERSGRLATPDDPDDLARAAALAARLDRIGVRERALAHCSLEVMLDGYEEVYAEVCDPAGEPVPA